MQDDDPKAESLLLMIWRGKEAARCDGDIQGYSSLAHILLSRVKKASGKSTTLMQIIQNFFSPNYAVNYSF